MRGLPGSSKAAAKGEAMLKVAIVGCGKIADAHASQIRRLDGCKMVAACDSEPLMAKQFCDRFSVKLATCSLAQLLGEAKPDVVHVTTPPQSHFDITRQCLEAGAHVYVEKPFTLDFLEAEKLLALATATGRKITAGHDEQFAHVARRMRALVASGYLGGPPIHMESTWCYDLSDEKYARTFLGDKQHWVRRLPGQLLQNVISHGLAKIAEYLTGDDPKISVVGFVSPYLKDLGEREIIDELRVIMTGDHGATAYFTFSSQMRPLFHQFCLYGPKNGLRIDMDKELLLTLPGKKFKSYLEMFVPPLVLGKESCSNLLHNARLFMARDFHMDSGKKYLIEAFYRSIAGEGPLPIPHEQIRRTALMMDRIFEQLRTNRRPAEATTGPNQCVFENITKPPQKDVLAGI
jgi:predicted dehydrogenase